MKQLLALLLFVPSLCLAQVPNYVSTEGLVAWYPLDGNGQDMSGNGYHGTMVGTSPSVDRWGLENNCLAFDGLYDRISVPDLANVGSPSYTVSAWFMLESLENERYLVSHSYDGINPRQLGMRTYVNSNTGDLGITTEFNPLDESANQVMLSTCEYSIGEWHQLTMVYDIDSIKQFFDGALIGAETLTAGSETSPHSFSIGYMPHDDLSIYGYFLHGRIDEVGIWNRALSESEIQSLYTNEIDDYGCTNPDACNFDAEASVDDGSCQLPPLVELPAHSTFLHSPAVLHAGYGYDEYQWTTGETTPTIVVNEPGDYGVMVTTYSQDNQQSLMIEGSDSPGATIPNPNLDSTSFTFSIDFKSSVGGSLFRNLGGNGNEVHGYYLRFEAGGQLHFDLNNLGTPALYPDGGNVLYLNSSSGYTDNEWHNTIVTYDHTSLQAKMYVDGGLVDIQTLSTSIVSSYNSEPLFIGYDAFTGNLDNLTIWNRAVGAGEVALLSSCPPTPDDELIGLWKFEGNGNNEASGEEEAFTLIGASYSLDVPNNSCMTTCTSNDSTHVDFLFIEDLCGEGTAWDSTLAQCISIADTIYIEPIACAPSCGEGTVWDPVNEECIIAIPADLNYDGCVSVNDLLVLLAVHGTCPPYPEWPDEPTDTTWTCGDPMTYWDYDYATVLIGDQCWFAENLRTALFANGDSIPTALTEAEWTSTTAGATAVYGNGNSTCSNYSPDIEACDEALSLAEYGRLYNWYAVDDAHGLCPAGWHVPTDGECTELEETITSLGFAGTEGTALKSTSGWADFNGASGNGTDDFGFSALAGGYRNGVNGYFVNAGHYCSWWSSSPIGGSAWNRNLLYYRADIDRVNNDPHFGLSVRCIKD